MTPEVDCACRIDPETGSVAFELAEAAARLEDALELDLDLAVGVEAALMLEPPADGAGLLGARSSARPAVPFGRPLYGPGDRRGPTVGDDVLAWKRMLWRWDSHTFPGPASRFDRVFNARTAAATRVAQRAWGLTPSGNVGRPTFQRSLRALRARGAHRPQQSAWDALALKLYRAARPRVPPARCAPWAAGTTVRRGAGVRDHGRRPLGNWQSDHAIDAHMLPGSRIVVPKAGYVSRFGGRDPRLGPAWPLFGQHVTVECDDGDAFFFTHLGRDVELVLGERVVAGELVGRVADWPGSSSMDHTHIGERRGNPEQLYSWPTVKLPTAD